MTLYGRSTTWAAALALGLAGLIAVGAALVFAPSARTAASAFELTVEGRDTEQWEGHEFIGSESVRTFRSRAPFCETGTVVEDASRGWVWRFTCDDGTGGLRVSIPQGWRPTASGTYTTWNILDGSGSFAGLRGKGSLRSELLGSEGSMSDSRVVVTWRSTFQGVVERVDRDEVAPSIAIASVRATKLGRPAGAYALRLRITLRDDVSDNWVSYTLRASAGGEELARRFGTAMTGAVPMTLRIRPPAGARTVHLKLTGEDPVGNAVTVRRTLSLPR